MDNKEALAIIKALMDGINPLTGEVLPSEAISSRLVKLGKIELLPHQ